MLAYLLCSEHYVTCKKYDVSLSRLFQVEKGTCLVLFDAIYWKTQTHAQSNCRQYYAQFTNGESIISHFSSYINSYFQYLLTFSQFHSQ